MARILEETTVAYF